MKLRTLLGIVVLAACSVGNSLLSGQQSPPTPTLSAAQFDVVSIKPHKDDGGPGGGMRTLPDGTFMATNIRIRQIMNAASPEPVTDITGFPDWVMTERYDIIAKPTPDSNPTREQRNQMMHNMMLDRMKVVGHVEEVERTTFALVLARSDGRLGPQLKRSTLDCMGEDRDKGSARVGLGHIEMTGGVLDQIIRSLPAGGVVTNRTGLEGCFDLKLDFAVPRLNADPSAPVDDAPQFVTALQEQLGLKLVPEKTMVKIFVVDHIERPTPN